MELLRAKAETRGYFLRSDALHAGWTDKWLHRGVRTGRLTRIRQGAYCPSDIWRPMSERGRFLARSLAAYELTRGDIALSHTSALAVYGAPLYGAPLSRVHLTYRGAGTAQVEAGTTRHANSRPPAAFVCIDGVWVTDPAWTAIGAMTILPVEACVVSGDWMVNQGLTTRDALWALKTELNHHPRTRHLEVAVRMIDGKSQSPGESRCRCLFRMMGLPRPELQWPVHDTNGDLIGVTDFAWPARNVYGEFDGKVKYGRLLRPGQSPGDVVFEEKKREDAIRRATGGHVVRWTWSDLTPTSPPSQQITTLLDRAA
jgi:hypothetical protein